jgi:hypothetical protein
MVDLDCNISAWSRVTLSQSALTCAVVWLHLHQCLTVTLQSSTKHVLSKLALVTVPTPFYLSECCALLLRRSRTEGFSNCSKFCSQQCFHSLTTHMKTFSCTCQPATNAVNTTVLTCTSKLANWGCQLERPSSLCC